jgi:hypothetical protein
LLPARSHLRSHRNADRSRASTDACGVWSSSSTVVRSAGTWSVTIFPYTLEIDVEVSVRGDVGNAVDLRPRDSSMPILIPSRAGRSRPQRSRAPAGPRPGPVDARGTPDARRGRSRRSGDALGDVFGQRLSRSALTARWLRAGSAQSRDRRWRAPSHRPRRQGQPADESPSLPKARRLRGAVAVRDSLDLRAPLAKHFKGLDDTSPTRPRQGRSTCEGRRLAVRAGKFQLPRRARDRFVAQAVTRSVGANVRFRSSATAVRAAPDAPARRPERAWAARRQMLACLRDA